MQSRTSSEKSRSTRITLYQKVIIPFIGAASLIWFLIRVIPKPSRAMYPCQRVAFPIASGFVIWVMGVFSSIFLFKNLKALLRSGRFVYTALTLFLLFGALGLTFFANPSTRVIAADDPFEPTDPPNSPMGEAKGIFPGRVVWAYNTEATSWNGSGSYTDDRYTNQTVVNDMVSKSLRDLTGTTSDAAAWDALFHHFNQTHGYGDTGYQSGEKIAVKINLNACGSYNVSPTSFYSSPQTILAMLTQLVERAGVNPADITFFDATRYVPQSIYDKCKNAYPDVVLADWEGGKGREKVQRDTNAQIKFSQELDLEPDGGNPTYVPKQVSQAKYLINMGQLKGHNLAGITLNGKNQFGAIMSYPPDGNPQSSAPKNAGLHPYVCVHDDFHSTGHWNFDKRAMGTYNTIVDLMGYEHLGAKTMLFFIDGLYSAPDQSTSLQTSHKWKSFNNDWPNSIFMSQDFVAIESVCLDFLREEATQTNCKGNVDNYLHEAALANDPPSGIVYDPEQDGTPLKSLGVHEHWNNATDKQYTRNLGTGDGIELVVAGTGTSIQNNYNGTPSNFVTISNYPNPFNAQTKISYTLAKYSAVILDVYAINGERVMSLLNEHQSSGRHDVVWNGAGYNGSVLPSGLYLLRLQTDQEISFHKMTLAK